jgi:hypothetical protein
VSKIRRVASRLRLLSSEVNDEEPFLLGLDLGFDLSGQVAVDRTGAVFLRAFVAFTITLVPACFRPGAAHSLLRGLFVPRLRMIASGLAATVMPLARFVLVVDHFWGASNSVLIQEIKSEIGGYGSERSADDGRRLRCRKSLIHFQGIQTLVAAPRL